MTSINVNKVSHRKIIVRDNGYMDEYAGIEMDFFNSRYFSINKGLLKLMGLWPYQHTWAKLIIRVVFSSIMVIFVIPHFICTYVTKNDPDKVIQAIGTIFYFFAISMKYFLYMHTEQKIKFLYINIVENWKLLENKTERNILLKYSEFGRLLTVGYVAYMVSALIVFITMPAFPPILDNIIPLANNETRRKIFILDGEYLVDKFEYYKTIYLFEGLTCILTVFIFITVDAAYAVTVEQCIGLLAVVKFRLNVATKYANQPETPDCEMKDMAYEALTRAAKLHINVFQLNEVNVLTAQIRMQMMQINDLFNFRFARVLEASYSTAFLMVIASNIVLISAGSVVILIYLDRPYELSRYILIYLGLMIHMFYLSWPGQQLIDSSTDIFHHVFYIEWYDCSIKCRMLLKFMMQRSVRAIELTGGGFYTMNLENYGAIIKTSLSYMAVFSSFR